MPPEQALSAAQAEQASLRASLADQSDPNRAATASAAAPAQAASPAPGAAAERDRAELQRLRGEVVSLKARLATLASQATASAAASASGGDASPPTATLRLSEMRDVGQATPAALLQSELWAITHGDTNRLLQLLDVDPRAKEVAMLRSLRPLLDATDPQREALLAEAEQKMGGFRVLGDSPAEDNDRWVTLEAVARDGTADRTRLRVRRVGADWKGVIGPDGAPVEEHLRANGTPSPVRR